MLERLTQDEQRALMELLSYLAKADGSVADVEREVLQQYANLVSIELDEITGTYAPEELVKIFHSTTSKVIVLEELMRMAYIDDMFTDSEQSVILDIAELLGVPLPLLRQIEDWVLDGLRWIDKGEELLLQAESMMR